MALSSASMWLRCTLSMKRWWALTRPRSASSSSARLALTRVVMREARCSGSLWPSMSACSTARPPLPRMSLSTTLSLRLASSSTFSMRCTCAARSRTNCLRVRVSVRSSCTATGGTKLARISPWASRSASHMASLTSVLRPGTFLTCAALASTSSKWPSSTCHTGFQYTPVASMATCSTPKESSQSPGPAAPRSWWRRCALPATAGRRRRCARRPRPSACARPVLHSAGR